MEINVSEDRENTVAGRREIEFYISDENITPSKEEAKKALCKKLNLAPDNTVIVRLDQVFGTKKTNAVAHSYKDQKMLKMMEPSYLEERVERKAKKAAKKAEGGAAEAPKAEKKEEKEVAKK